MCIFQSVVLTMLASPHAVRQAAYILHKVSRTLDYRLFRLESTIWPNGPAVLTSLCVLCIDLSPQLAAVHSMGNTKTPFLNGIEPLACIRNTYTHPETPGKHFCANLNLGGEIPPYLTTSLTILMRDFSGPPQPMSAQANPYTCTPDFRSWFFRENYFSIMTVSVCLSYTL
jgi:hypothetical protein